ncbi:hypothetical protein BGZ51_004403 [Haplosporangium sp. Z 767]|nr:hypothetical protein BGZ51_004403 [Haplosporangium sp. Z 767]KAF9183998.1 hypothetical protein BGZ50_003931 [Haplosporangium sp. Z 11]
MAAPHPEYLIDTTTSTATDQYADDTPPYHTSTPHNHAPEPPIEYNWGHELAIDWTSHGITQGIFQFQPHVRNAEHPTARASASGGTHVCHGGDITAVTSCEMMSCLSRHDEVLLDEATFTDPSKPLGLHLYYHTRHYLEPVTTSDPLVHVRFVFAAHQLPRGDKFSDLVGPVRINHSIDTYLIPHESRPVDHDQDVVLGLSGTLDRVCSGLRNLLQIMAPNPEGFSFWRLDLLVQRTLKHLFVGEHDDPGDSASAVAPCLRKAMGHWYGCISSANDESILTLQSCSLDTIIDAVNYVGQIFVQEEAALGPCKNFYCGGRPSILPVLTTLHPDVRRMVAQMDRRVPAGYIFRPEMQTCLKSMQRKRYHLQVYLNTAVAVLLFEPIGEPLRRSCESTGVALNISDRIASKEDEFRVCDIGADELQSLQESIVGIVSWKVAIIRDDWSVMLYIPERVVLELKNGMMEDDREHLGFVHQMMPLQEFGLIGRCDTRLEPAEKESILWIRSGSSVGIANAVNVVVAMIYG